MHQGHGLALDEWLAGEVRLRGIRENAAVLAVLELRPGRRAETARAYCHEHPDRAGALADLLAVLDQPGSAPGLPHLSGWARRHSASGSVSGSVAGHGSGSRDRRQVRWTRANQAG
jgi:hypothetical protein